jgi:hypothetical protein
VWTYEKRAAITYYLLQKKNKTSWVKFKIATGENGATRRDRDEPFVAVPLRFAILHLARNQPGPIRLTEIM